MKRTRRSGRWRRSRSTGSAELVAYYTIRGDAAVDRAAVLRLLRDRLPAYMVPAFLEELPAGAVGAGLRIRLHKRIPHGAGLGGGDDGLASAGVEEPRNGAADQRHYFLRQ